jgi:hypothetical protein
MKRQPSIPVIFLILWITFGCNLFENIPDIQSKTVIPLATIFPTVGPENNLFDHDDFRLNYPADWKPIHEIFGLQPSTKYNSEFEATEIFGVGSPGKDGKKMGAYCKILIKEDVNPERSLASMMDIAYQGLSEYPDAEISQKKIQISGIDGLEKIYRRPSGEPWYQVRDVWLMRGSQVYIFSCWTYPENYDMDAPVFSFMLNSLQFK